MRNLFFKWFKRHAISLPFEGFPSPRIPAWWPGVALLLALGASVHAQQGNQVTNSADYIVVDIGANYRVEVAETAGIGADVGIATLTTVE
ncbi:MAG TPA: hypothetical protein VNU95_00075 [Candidatus Acidoferrales bacterium]|nr:hypothetical protein [Candidatus Acidoferrales bacterium]